MRKGKITVLGCLVLASCVRENVPRETAVNVPVSVAPPSSVRPEPPSPPMRAMRAIVLAGPNEIRNVAWVHEDAVAITNRELWHFRPEDPGRVRITQLTRPTGLHSVLAVARGGRAGRVAVALEDGSVDVIEADGKRLCTLAPGRHVVGMRFSPDGQTLAITRTNTGRMVKQTTLVDVASGVVKSRVDGGNVVFDREGKRIAARGGVFEVEGGREVAPWKEGLLHAGVMGGMSHRRAVMDDVTRGFFGDVAFYANAMGKDVALIDSNGKTTRIAATCGAAKKLTSVADAAHGRVIGICKDGVIVTDLAKGTSTRIHFPVPKTVPPKPPEVLFPPDGATFALRGPDGYRTRIVDPIAGTTHEETTAEKGTFQSFGNFTFQFFENIFDHHQGRCAGPAGARDDIECDNPAWRADGAYRMRVFGGLSVTSRSDAIALGSSADVIDWRFLQDSLCELYYCVGPTFEWHDGALEAWTRTPERSNNRGFRLRFGPPSAKDPTVFDPTAACGKEPYLQRADDRVTLYTSLDRQCICTKNGCTPWRDWVLAATEDGPILTLGTNSHMDETVVELHQPDERVTRTKLPGSCTVGAFGPNQHAFVACELDERTEIVELALPDLSVVRRRAAPPIGGITEMFGVPDGVIAVNEWRQSIFGVILDQAWFASDEPLRDTPFVFAIPELGFGIFQGADGKVQIAGVRPHPDFYPFGVRCFDGARLHPFDACR